MAQIVTMFAVMQTVENNVRSDAQESLTIGAAVFLLFKREVAAQPNYWGKGGLALLALTGLFYLMAWPMRVWLAYLSGLVQVVALVAYTARYRPLIFNTPGSPLSDTSDKARAPS